jgi:hypothetical protein
MTTRVNRIERPTATALLAGLLAAALCLPAFAVPQIESNYGGQSPWYSAELNSQGNTGAALGRGGFSNILNPAGLAWSTSLHLDLGLFLVRHEEDRFMPVQDSFSNKVVDMVVASNQKTWLGGGFGLALRNPRLPITLGLSLVERYPFRYLFDEEVRDPRANPPIPRDTIIENRSYQVSGALRTLSLGLAGCVLPERLSVGAAVHYAFGDRDAQWNRQYFTSTPSYEQRHDWHLSGFNATVGVQARLSERVTLGVAYETRLEVEGDHQASLLTEGDDEPDETVTRQKMRYPDYWRFGMAFYPRSDPRTVFTADLVYADWTELEDSRGDDDDLSYLLDGRILQEVVDVRIGVEHTFYNQARMRFGFRRYDSYGDRDGGNSIFSAGAGWPLAAGMMSFSLELNKVQSVQPHIYPYPSGYYSADVTRVDDRRVRLGFSWSRSF